LNFIVVCFYIILGINSILPVRKFTGSIEEMRNNEKPLYSMPQGAGWLFGKIRYCFY
jgi:hypothetical protein